MSAARCGGAWIRIAGLLVVWAVFVFVSAPHNALADDETDCLRCHEDAKPWFKKQVVHKPFKDKKCQECHKFHEFKQQLVLQRQGAELCLKCHTNFPDMIVGKKHWPVEQGLCWSCHDPHGSNEKKLLRESDLGSPCFTCHENIQFDLFIEHPHTPFFKQECVRCHNPHASEQPSNLRRRVDLLCTECHDWPTVRGKHLNYFTEPVRCTVCHRAHGSSLAKLIDSAIHPPVIEDCRNCHEPVRPGDKPRLDVSIADLCGGCHDVTDGATVEHPPAAEGECLTCHEPHRTQNSALLRKRAPKLCAECHDLEPDASTASTHPPFADGECARCHNPHGSKHKSILRDAIPGLCFNCHRALAARIDSTAVVHPPAEEGACADCHLPHQSPLGSLLKAGMTGLCSSCHDAAPDGVSNHAPFASGVCTACHDPHAGPSGLVKAAGNDLCLRCHEEFRDLADDPGAHPAAVDNCMNCHQPHKSKQGRLLADAVPALCEGCHGVVTKEFPNHPKITADDSCLDCHNPHRN